MKALVVIFGLTSGFATMQGIYWYNNQRTVYEYIDLPVYIEVEKKPHSYLVIDSSYIDHEGDYESCKAYKDSYKNHHDYIVVAQH